MNINISSQGLELINQEFLPDNFTFIIGNRSYHCNKIQADFLSPIVSKIHKVDPLIDSFKIETKDPDGDFQTFIDFLKKGEMKIIPQKFSFYIQVSGLLGNSEIINSLMNLITYEFEKEEFQLTNIIEKLILFDQLNIPEKNSFFDYVASHFSDICQHIYNKKLSYETLASIISSSSLQLENESQLVTFILNIVNQEKDEKYLSLIEYVDFEYINYNDLLSLQLVLEKYQISLKVIVDKLFQKIISKPSTFSNILNFEYSPDRKNKLNGIINYLNHESKGICSKNGTINVTCSSTQVSSYSFSAQDCRHLCNYNDLSDRSMWSPNNEENCFIQFDFIKNKVNLSSYTFQTPVKPTKDYPKSWKIECSNDSINWKVVDQKIDQVCMNNENACVNFRCNVNNNEFFRYIRIVSLSPCWNGDSRYYFDLSAVEFFGFLRIEKESKLSE